ncbi:stellacyanin [Physcomitrium patens]|uniref:Phytocyanin domain-containing protein n=1 Tax=Physcomitrium patens TaxID=3218 RepID=A0A2K1KMZ0_PHYPA|nr:stellacyanin-like [Physcomitrium patens]PNR55143.1 hypothetical protein PHYPA_006037 [Physcomitrium patens]|eukprot:XP_024374033.1 stellacyanin-like [Physcomitrella patens]
MAQGRCSAMLAVALLVVSAAVVAQAVTYDVPRWTVPAAANADVYTTWAANVSNFLKPGDVLVFQYSAAAHNVLTLATKANYDNCVKTSPLNTTSTGNDALVVKAGGNYFICGIPTHCESGQKVAVNVSAATGTPETPGTPAAPGTPAPQGPSSATSLTVRQTFAAVSVALSASLIIW